ncbi:MAG: hypothetical protein R3C59_03580 [Planctomycetaceae bacterium]
MNPNTLSNLGHDGATEALKLRALAITALLKANVEHGDQFAREWKVISFDSGGYTIASSAGKSLPISSSNRDVIEAVYQSVAANLGR